MCLIATHIYEANQWGYRSPMPPNTSAMVLAFGIVMVQQVGNTLG